MNGAWIPESMRLFFTQVLNREFRAMMHFKSTLRILLLPLFLLAGSCTNDPDEGAKPPGGGKAYGTFQVSLIAPTDITQGYTSVLGQLYDGPTPSPVNWVEAEKGGSCKLLTPKVPFCATPCGSGSTCVADGQCQVYPKAIGAGKVSVSGIKTKDGATAFTMDPLNKSYQPAAGAILAFPPFAEGDAVTFSAAGDTAAAAFSISAKGIGPLHVLNDSITLSDGQAISLKWTPPANAANSSISVMVDISHHGGSKGKIECEGPDNGAMEISAALVDKLKALGVSGFPKIEVSRRSVGASASADAELVLESMVNKDLNIPGLISCGGDEDCPDGKLCQQDRQCE
jgi:hypothetical protein